MGQPALGRCLDHLSTICCGVGLRQRRRPPVGPTSTTALAGPLVPESFLGLIPRAESGQLCAGCSIPKAEERGIRLGQLELVLSFIRENCEASGWAGLDGRPLVPGEVNLYSVVQHIVKPATAPRQCSFIEIVAESPQPPQWFVSHWWGEPVAEFLACLEQHSADRHLPADGSYWVCAYANNQWNIQADMGDDPSSSSFRRAMRLCSGTVSVLDAGSVCYSRIWCIFEVFISIGDRQGQAQDYMYDVYTSAADEQFAYEGHGAVGITDGFAAADGDDLEKRSRRKRHRELRFPWPLQETALAVKLQTAQASQEADRRQILNSIAGAPDLTAPPPASHPSYEHLNAVLRGRFAAASWVKAVERCQDLALHGQLLAASGLSTVSLHFGGGCLKVIQDSVVELLARSLPPLLQQLFLGFAGCELLTDASLHAVAEQLPARASTLCRLELRFSACKKITSKGVATLADGLSELPKLAHVELDFQQCRIASSAAEKVAESLGRIVHRLDTVVLRGLSTTGSKRLSAEGNAVMRKARELEEKMPAAGSKRSGRS